MIYEEIDRMLAMNNEFYEIFKDFSDILTLDIFKIIFELANDTFLEILKYYCTVHYFSTGNEELLLELEPIAKYSVYEDEFMLNKKKRFERSHKKIKLEKYKIIFEESAFHGDDLYEYFYISKILELEDKICIYFEDENDLKLLILSMLPKLKDLCIDEFRVLSFNISWEAMEGQKNKMFICKGMDDPNKNKCLSNLNSFLEDVIPDYGLDIILLQEVSREQHIIKTIRKFKDYKYKLVKVNKEKMMTIYDSTFLTLDSEYNEIHGSIDKVGGSRPYLALFFNDQICIVNAHHDHNDKDKIIRIFKSIARDDVEGKFIEKMKKYQIILGGDINHNLINQNMQVKNIEKSFISSTLNNPVNEGLYTCCDIYNGLYSKNLYTSYFKLNKYFGTEDSYDHILFSVGDMIIEDYDGAEIMDPKAKISDHAPVYSVLGIKL